jgi:hypothetical protein
MDEADETAAFHPQLPRTKAVGLLTVGFQMDCRVPSALLARDDHFLLEKSRSPPESGKILF